MKNANRTFLYVYGGRLLPVVDDQSIDEFIDGIDTTEILYLDVSVNFDLKNPAWNLLTADNLIAFHTIFVRVMSNFFIGELECLLF
ncbi:6963_t:CDS:2 [Entrophospora sp. SA101]|nr:6963_t:CDS:2 [Entrophospora sp. SA101]